MPGRSRNRSTWLSSEKTERLSRAFKSVSFTDDDDNKLMLLPNYKDTTKFINLPVIDNEMTNSFVSLLELDSEDNTCSFPDYCQMADLHGIRQAIANHIKDSYNSSVQTYMEEHNVASLVGLLLHKLARAQPGDPLEFIVEHCVKEQNTRASMGLSENELVLLLGAGELDQAKDAIRNESCRLTGVDEYNRNPLHLAVFNCETDEGLEVLTMLLAKGCPGLNGKDNEAWTPLHWASFVGNEAAVQLLVDYKADPNVENNMGRTPYLVASDWGNDAIIELLEEAEQQNTDLVKEMLKSSPSANSELVRRLASNERRQSIKVLTSAFSMELKGAEEEVAGGDNGDGSEGVPDGQGELTEQEKAVLASNAPNHIPPKVVEQARFLSNSSNKGSTQNRTAEAGGVSQPTFVAPIGQNVMAHMPSSLDWLWIGNRRDASDQNRLMAAGIKYIVNCTMEYLEGGVRNYHEADPHFRYCRIPMRDNEQQVLGILYLKKAWDFIDDARKHADGNVLIHCIMGQSRSVIVLVSYLMRHLDIDYQAALDMVVSVRSMAEPNPGFERQLLDHDANGAIRGGGGGGTYLLPCPFQCLVLVPAMDLRTRLSADYSNVKLMEPDEDTYPKAAVLQVLGMISDGESYMEDKRMVLRDASGQISEAKVKGEAARGARASVLSGDDKAADLRAMPFVDPINEKLLPIGESRDGPHVQVGVVCRKGRKGTEDHTPNQDSFSVTLLDDNTVVGLVCDGHGPFGHLISQRSTQSAANLVCQRLRGADETTGIEAKLKAAVQECQDDIIRFANATGFPADNSGSSLACLVVEPLDRAANKLVVHVAWCGDSKVVAGKYDKKDVETIVKETKDHTPEDPAEAKRIDERGGEMREIAGGSKRIFVKGTNLPGEAKLL
ncbi:hypothetical protein FOZ62_029994 [Perkinsus olseni]|uniref:protein-tyrosine-phosphatase n=2 Tax=Perkinsus olseni TaxID=32597 RepID=A0A7J6TNI0_PEROL|nr:hypothetical protein FOZ62_029994 [Perkinsus olseni]